MYFSPLLLAFASLVGGMPQTPSTPSPSPSPSPSPAPGMTLQVSYFSACINDPAHEYANRTSFLVWDDTGDFGALCSVAVNEPLYSETDWHECDAHTTGAYVVVSFYIGEGFDKVGLKKGWESNGTYMIGTAMQETHWKQGRGGNVTETGVKESYTRMEAWEFDITSIVA